MIWAGEAEVHLLLIYAWLLRAAAFLADEVILYLLRLHKNAGIRKK